MNAGKNVAADIAIKLCESVASKIEGKTLGTFNSMFQCILIIVNHYSIFKDQ